MLLILFQSTVNAQAEDLNQKRISLNVIESSIVETLQLIEEQTDLNFVYRDDLFQQSTNVDFKVENSTVNEVLNQLLIENGFVYKRTDNVIAVKARNVVGQPEENQFWLKGSVADDKGEPIPGVNIVIESTGKGVISNMDGNYEIKVAKGDVLKFSFIGFKTQVVLVKDEQVQDVVLYPEMENLEEVAVVAFGTQKKESVVSSITTVRPEKLMSSNSDLTASFAGNIPGVIAWQTGGTPGALTENEMNTKFYIRGITSFQSNANIDPLILLDGVECSKLDLSRINPDDIESFSVLKDASATAMYGARGANGVIIVKTKKGKAGDVYTSFRAETIWSAPTREIDIVDPITYMRRYNEAILSNDPMATPRYSAEEILRRQSKKYPNWLYPANDWYKQLFKDHIINNHYSLNLRGGTNKVQYYASLSYNDDEGMLKTDKLNQFDCNIENKQITFRTNLNVNLTKKAKLSLTSFSTYDKYHGPSADVRQAYYMAFRSNPVDFAPTYPADKHHNWPHILFGCVSNSYNPYMEIQKGYSERKRYSTINQLEYIQNLSTFCKGLEFRFAGSMNKVGYFKDRYETLPAFYRLDDFDFATGEHKLVALNENTADRTVKKIDQNLTQAATSYECRFTGLHTAAWGDHQTSLTGVVSLRERDDNSPATLQNSLPNRNLGYSARGTYGYKSRYFVETSFGYNGSERFAKDNKMGFFPAFGLAWIPTSENFMRSTSKWLSYMKLRFSYGKVGNDGIIKNPRFVYIQNIEQVTTGQSLNFGGAPSHYYRIWDYKNPGITWEIAEQHNLGLDFKFFNGFIDCTIDAYQEVRHNVCAKRTATPGSLGLYRAPLDNIGKTRSRGFDFSGKIQHAFSEDFYFIFNNTITYNKTTFLEIEEATNKPKYQSFIGNEISQSFGYIAEGLFQSQEEIMSSPHQDGKVRPGDIKYRDINGDNKIDINDKVPIGYPETPRIIYGLNAFVHYKNWELNMQFQGMGNRSFFINAGEISPFYQNRALLSAINKSHWYPGSTENKPLWPRLSDKNLTDHNPQETYDANDAGKNNRSTYFLRNGKFLRCKLIELSYYIPKSLAEKAHLKNCRIYCRASNPFLWSSFKLWDVELGNNGFNYPIQKTYSLGVNLSF